jgi:hypothetical protein
MLRVMKQKALEQNEESSQKRTASTSIRTENLPKTRQQVLVSHVPISVGSRSAAPSANSSISSKGEASVDVRQSKEIAFAMVHFHDADRQSAHLAQEDSRNESSPIVDASYPSTPLQKRKSSTMASVLTLSPPKSNRRKVSLDESNIANSPASKKPRLDAGPYYKEARPIAPAPSPMILLARDRDESCLNRLHIFVRNQIEVFTATPTELAQPAPGRKQPIRLHQVGLRCIHCRHLPSRKRVKRAVCYPSSVGRVYHSVSDMKFDHFSNCQELPPDVRATFETLKVKGKKGHDKKSSGGKGYTSSTAQYYHDAAVRMGMVEGLGGIFMSTSPNPADAQFAQLQSSLAPRQEITAMSAMIRNFPSIHGLDARQDFNLSNATHMQSMLLMNVFAKNNAALSSVGKPSIRHAPTSNSGHERVKLAEHSDPEYLNPLHCFVRQHVEVFTADKDDISAPAPGRKTRVVIGQVGIRCIHCAKLPSKERVKRAICYPPSVSGIYHSVSNMKFDHFGLCQGLPPKPREEFASLKTSCSRRGTAGNNSSRSSASSTAQYYHDSAVRKGLVDTEAGIRFNGVQRTTENKPALSTPSRLPSGMSALMMAASQAA